VSDSETEHSEVTGTTSSSSGITTALTIGALASLGAGLVHATAVSAHAESETLSRVFIGVALAQIGVAVAMLLRPGRWSAAAAIAVNGAAAVGWLLTRTTGISWIDGLENSESPQRADTLAMILAVVSVIAAVPAVVRDARPGRVRGAVLLAAAVVAALTVPAMASANDHEHSHAEGEEHEHAEGTEHDDAAHDESAHDDAAHSHDASETDADGAAAADQDESAHSHDAATGDEDTAHSHDTSSAWPRPWDPSQPIDFSGVEGVTPEQQARAEQLAADTLAILPQFADVTTIGALGFSSIGDAGTGFEHYVNTGYIGDDEFLNPQYPESLVYRVGPGADDRTLVSAMFIAKEMRIDDPELVDFGGPLMQWHVHENLCWGLGDDGRPKVVALTDENGNCPPGSINAGGENPMVHVWIAPHECGPFAALEGHGAGQVAEGTVTRADQCGHDHGSGGGDEETAAAVSPVPYDPSLPIDLGGVDGVTPQQQAFAENLVAATVRDLPQWADPAVAEAAGFYSIGDAGTGHEHYVNWTWIDDDVWLDPDHPESLVYEPQPDGSKQLVSAMFMLPPSITLDDVPDWGGRLMQWHIHDDLCFNNDPVAPRVAALTSVGGSCQPPLVKMQPAAMIHVWITPHECGPFAALEGVGAGQVRPGEEHWCDHAHGSGGH